MEIEPVHLAGNESKPQMARENISSTENKISQNHEPSIIFEGHLTSKETLPEDTHHECKRYN